MYFTDVIVKKHMYVIYTYIFEDVLKILTAGDIR